MIISPIKEESITEILSEQPTNTLYEQARYYARIFKALDDPHRLAIVLLLLRDGPCTQVKIQQKLAQNYGIWLAQPTIAYHQRLLIAAGLIEYTSSKQYRYFYCARPEMIEWFLADIEHADREGSDAQ